MKNFLICKDTMIIQQETYYIICIIKVIINVLAQIQQDKQMQLLLNKINFTEKLEKDDDATRPFIVKEQKKLL